MKVKLIAIAIVFLKMVSHSSTGQSRIDSLENLLNKPLNDSLRTEVMIKLGFRYAFVDYQKALEVSRAANDLAVKHKFREMITRNTMSMGIIHFLSREYDSAIRYHRRSIELAIEINDSLLLAKNLNSIGLIHLNQARYQLALNHLQRSNAIHTSINFLPGMANTSNNIGNIYQRTEQYELAVESYKKSLAISKQTDNVRGEASAYINIGASFLRNNEFDSAKYYQRLGLKLNTVDQNKSGMAIALRNLADISLKQKNYRQAHDLYQRAVTLMDEMGGGRAGPISSLGITHAYLGYFTKARSLLQRAIEVAEGQGDSWEKSEALRRLALTYEMQDDHDRSLHYFKQHVSLKDSLFDKEKSNQLFELQTFYETELKNNEIAKLAANNKVQSLQISKGKQERNILIVFSALVITLAILFYALFRQKKKSLNEREVLLKEIHHRVKNNLQVISSLLNLQSESLESEVAKEAVKEGQHRVKSMALIHQKLYSTEDVRGVDVQDYLENLSAELFRAFGLDQDKVAFEVMTSGLKLDIDTVIPLGLIVNELITNAIKYAFQDMDKGILRIEMTELGENLSVLVQDNGKGMDEKAMQSNNSFGWKMIKSLCRKLKAEISVQSEGGTQVQLLLSNYKLVT